jgi:hypothetical protein
MKKNIFPVITQFVVLVAPVSPNFASGVLAEEPAVKSFNRIPYPSGGFGIDERERLRSLTKGDNLELSFALRNKEYLGRSRIMKLPGMLRQMGPVGFVGSELF